MIEREIKLAAEVGVVLPDLTDPERGISEGPRTTVQLDATYYDTSTLALARWGVTLRSRTGEPGPVWTLKLPFGLENSELSRHELTFDEPSGLIPSRLRLAARAYTRSQDLGPVVRLHTERTEFDLEVDGTLVAKICDDAVCVDGAWEPIAAFREIEVELAPDSSKADSIDAVILRLRAAGFTPEEEPVAKAFRALGPHAFDPPDVAVTSIDKHATVGQVVRHLLAKSVTEIIGHHAGVCIGDSESVHQFRVAGRRLRSDLRTFSPLLDRHWTAWLRDELNWLGGEVGIGRDADVLSIRLRSQLARLPDPDAKTAQSLLQRLAETSTDAFERVVDVLSGDRYMTLLDALVDTAREPRFAAEPADLPDRPGRRIFRRLARQPWRRLKRAIAELEPDAPQTAMHASRIRAKRARYAAEAVAPLYGREARRFARAMADVQTVLGKFQDTAVAEAWLREAAKALPSTRLVAGELVGFERDDRSRLRDEFWAVWKKASKSKLRTWLK
ncbi:MAG: CYTH and CHAD domain-containing protein [Ilumatobacteraceae bacterium]